MDFETLCAGIQLQEEIRVEAIRYYRSEEFQKMRPLAEGLKSMETEAEARKRLRQLSGLLPEKSNIRDFQERFEIVRTDEASTDYAEWVFQTESSNIADYPERTSLQKTMKQHLLRGGKISSGYGLLKH